MVHIPKIKVHRLSQAWIYTLWDSVIEDTQAWSNKKFICAEKKNKSLCVSSYNEKVNILTLLSDPWSSRTISKELTYQIILFASLEK